jgi:hypothetical protein
MFLSESADTGVAVVQGLPKSPVVKVGGEGQERVVSPLTTATYPK